MSEHTEHGGLVHADLTRDPVQVELRAAYDRLGEQVQALDQAHRELDRERRRYRDLFNFAPDGYLVTDHLGTIREGNDAAVAMLGDGRDRLIGASLSAFVMPGWRRQFRQQFQRVLRDGQIRSCELRLKPSGGEPRPVEVNVVFEPGPRPDDDGSPTLPYPSGSLEPWATGNDGELIPDGRAGALWWMIRDVSERRQLEQEVVEAANAERSRIGRDLHDGLSTLAGGIMMAEVLQRRLARDAPAHAPSAGKLIDLLHDAVADARRISHALCPSYLEHDLAEALDHLRLTLQGNPAVKVQMVCPSPCPMAARPTVEHLYRIAQEAVQNAIRHGQAGRIQIQVHRGDHSIEMRVIDDGTGIDQAIGSTADGVGLRLMHHRASLIGGSVEVRPGDGGGTTVVCIAPLSA